MNKIINYILSDGSKTKRIVLHLLFCGLFYLMLLAWMWGNGASMQEAKYHFGFFSVDNMLTCLITLIIIMLLRYSIVYFLYPKFYSQKKWLSGILLLLLFMFVAYCLKFVLQKWILSFAVSPLFKQMGKNVAAKKLFDRSILFLWINITLWYLIVALAAQLGVSFLKKQRNMQLLNESRKELELNFLKSQIRPHFLFNALNSIYSKSLDMPQANQHLLAFSEVLRFCIYDKAKCVSVNDFQQMLQTVIQLQNNNTKAENKPFSLIENSTNESLFISKKEALKTLFYFLNHANEMQACAIQLEYLDTQIAVHFAASQTFYMAIQNEEVIYG